MSPVASRRSQILRICAKIKGAYMPAFFLLAVCLGANRIALAQQDVGYILGTVTDQTGGALPGVTVTITSQSTLLSQTVITNETGFYTSQPLQVGQYAVSFTKTGF